MIPIPVIGRLIGCLNGGRGPWQTVLSMQLNYGGRANVSYVSLETILKSLHARQGTCPPGAPCLLAQGSLLSGLSLVGTGLPPLAEARRPQKQCYI